MTIKELDMTQTALCTHDLDSITSVFYSGLSTEESRVKRVNVITFRDGSQEVAFITQDGIIRFIIDANDENAKAFVECIEKYLLTRLSGVAAQETPK